MSYRTENKDTYYEWYDYMSLAKITSKYCSHDFKYFTFAEYSLILNQLHNNRALLLSISLIFVF